MTAPARVWLSWTAGNPEPRGLSCVRDASNVVSYTDSPEWKRSSPTMSGPVPWQGWKAGERVVVSWEQLLKDHGPVTGVIESKVKPATEDAPKVLWPYLGGAMA